MDKRNEYGLREMHTALLKMLNDFDEICKHNEIIYSLGFGSMLGGVRDHGIIPWDDDIDIIIDRKNFQKLESVLSYSKTYVLEKNTARTLWLPRFRYKNKMRNSFEYELTIDTFIIDNVPDNKVEASIKLLLIRFIQGMIKNSPTLNKGNLYQKIASLASYLIGKLFTLSFKYRLYDKVSAISDSSSTKYSACYNAEYIYAGRKYNGRLLEEVISVDFDGLKIPVSKHYNSYLTELYGNYMIPPKIDERVPKHSL